MELIEGIVLKQINYKESSKIIYLYTSHGKVSVLVHGSNKLKSPYLNLVRVFSHVRLFVSGKDLKTLREGEVLNYFSSIPEDLNRYAYGLHLLETVYNFSNHNHDHEKLYLFLLKILSLISISDNFELYVMMFELKLLYLLGVQPLLKHCVFCENTKTLSFSIKDGGMVCENHGSYSEYKVSVIELMIKLYYYDLSLGEKIDFHAEDIVSLRLLIDSYYEYHLNYKSKSRQMIKELMAY